MGAVLQTMVDEKIGPGERKKEFLRLACQTFGKKDGVALRTYPDALSYALCAVGAKPGDSVAVSVLSPEIYHAVADSLSLKLLLVDINAENGCMSEEGVKSAFEKGASIILLHEPVCQLPLSLESLSDLGLPIIEDVTQSMGSHLDTHKPGQIGNIVVAAFEEDGVVSTGGGAVAVSSDEILLDALKNLVKIKSPYVELPDMNAALGIIQMGALEDSALQRSKLFRNFQQTLLKGGGTLFGCRNVDFASNGYVFPVIANTRPDEVVTFANKYGVSCKRTFTKSLGARYQDRFDLFPVANAALTRGLSFPVYPFLAPKEVETILKVIGHLP